MSGNMKRAGRKLVMLAACAGPLLAVGGCDVFDPYQRPYTWHPTGANQANIAAMVKNPNDLIVGHDDGRTDANPALIAVGRVSSDQPKSLPSANGGGGGGGGGGGSSGGGGGASASAGGN